MAKPPSHVVSLFNSPASTTTSPDAILTAIAARSAEKTKRFEKVIEAIDTRNIEDVSWALLSVAVEEIAEKGSTTLGRTTLMEVVRTLVQISRDRPQEEGKEGQLLEVQTWLRKKAE